MRVRTGRGANYIAPKLSQKDEGVPSDYVGIYDLFVTSEDVRALYGEERANMLRKASYENVLGLYNKYGSMDYDRFWNFHINEINYLKLNEFARFDKLADLCGYIKCFKTKVSSGKTARNLISFGIKMEHLKKYAEEKERCEREGIDFVAPIFKNKSNNNNKDIIDFGIVQLLLVENDPSTKCSVEKSEIYKRFEDWRKIRNIKKKDAFKMAMKEIVDNHPIKDLKSLEEYKVVTEFDKVFFVANADKRGTVSVNIQLDCEVHREMAEIIYRFNEDMENKLYAPKTMTQYVREAVARMNKQMPLKYTDTEKWEEYLKVQKELERLKGSEENENE